MAHPTKIHTYHCLCFQLALALPAPLDTLPKRTKDSAAICPTSPHGITLASSTYIEDEAVVLKLDDGFEKRYAVRCGRCGVMVGYVLDWASFGAGGEGRKEDVVYLLQGGLVGTEEVRKEGMGEAERCTFRRHVAAKLLEQQHTPASAQYDRHTRLVAIAQMCPSEKQTYRALRAQITTLSLVSKEFHLHALALEHRWLQNQPMNIEAFGASCNDPSNALASSEIVIELFSCQDFINPPPFINELIDSASGLKRIDKRGRRILSHRLRPSCPCKACGAADAPDLATLDRSILGALGRLWLQAMWKLPRSVRVVRVITALPDFGDAGNLKRTAGLGWGVLREEFRRAVGVGVEGEEDGGKGKGVVWEVVE